MRILTVGFDEEFAKEIEEEISGYFICIVDAAIDLYDAGNFTCFRHYELIIILDEGVKFSLERYVTEMKRKKKETKIIILTEDSQNQKFFYSLKVDDVVINHIYEPDLIAARYSLI